MAEWWRWYQAQLASRPLRTQLVTSGILWAAGDVVAQRVSASMQKQQQQQRQRQQEHQEAGGDISSGLKWKGVAISSLFGIGFVGPVGHYWYEGLEHTVKHRLRLRPNSAAFLATKLAADGLLFGPVHLLAFFTWTGLAAGQSWAEVRAAVARDFIPAFCTEGAAWPVVQLVNFRFVPVRHQLLYVNFFCLLDSAFLSWFKYQHDAAWKRRLTAFVTRNNSSSSSKAD